MYASCTQPSLPLRKEREATLAKFTGVGIHNSSYRLCFLYLWEFCCFSTHERFQSGNTKHAYKYPCFERTIVGGKVGAVTQI
eukprot:m.43592 g.43592  ORF g.43592 m.43592 type:complete len:82 (+) comp9985_c0_seq1:1524-1769(+)